MVKAGAAIFSYLGVVWVFLVVSVLAPGQTMSYALQTSEYSRVVREAEKIANLAFHKPTIVSNVAQKVVGPSLTSFGMKFVTGPIGWGLFGIATGLALWQVYYDASKMQQIKENASPPGGVTAPGFSGPTIEGPGFCAVSCPGGVQFYLVPGTYVYPSGPPGCNPGNVNPPPAPAGWSFWGCYGGHPSYPNGIWRYQHVVGSPSTADAVATPGGPPTQQQVHDYLNSLPPTSPLAPEQNVEQGGTTGATTTAQQTVSQPVTTTDVQTEVVHNTTITGGDVVVKANEPPPSGTTTTTTKEQGATTTTTTTTNPDGSKTEEQQQEVTASCVAGAHESRSVHTVWEAHKATWTSSTLLSYLTLLQNLTWPSTLPDIQLTSTVLGTQHVNFNEWAWFFTALRTLVIFGATLVAYRLVFAGRS